MTRPRRPRRIVSVWLPHLPIERWRATARRVRARPDDDAPVVLARDGPHGPVVHAACEAAAARGVRPEGRVVDAQAIHPDLRVEPADVAGDLASLDRLVFWARRWCPWTARDGHDGIVLDATGAAHLFGGEAGLLEDVVARFAAHALTARVAMAPTRLAARALARHGPASVACDARDVADRLAPLPVAALGLGPEPARLLARLGLRTVGALAGVPRTALMRRFADAPAEDNPLAALDRALGRTADPVAAPPDHARRIVRSRMAEPVADVLPHLPDLARRLCAMLETAGLGARTLTLSVRRSDGAEGAVDAATARATRDPAHVERLLRGKLDRIDPGFGIDLVALEARRVEPLGARQDGLDGGRDADADVAALLDRLTARLGPDRVSWSLWSESHLPERVERRAPALAAIPRPPPDIPAERPIRLLDAPEAIEVVYAVPEGPPARFRWRRAAFRTTRFAGPERIAPEWWRARAGTRLRDYYKVEVEDGRRFWIYREGVLGDGRGDAPGWFLHGFFA